LFTNESRPENMKFSLSSVGALVLCMAVTAHAAATSDAGPAIVAGKFVDALQHRHFKEAAAMFAPGQPQDVLAIERTLERIDESVGGFSAMHPVPALPNGRSIKLEVTARKTTVPGIQKFIQVRYASSARDGQPVFYEINLSADGTPPHLLSLGVHLPASAPQSTARADRLMRLISR
jgi:hypothetical protein